jgi:hypothetical protein
MSKKLIWLDNYKLDCIFEGLLINITKQRLVPSETVENNFEGEKILFNLIIIHIFSVLHFKNFEQKIIFFLNLKL